MPNANDIIKLIGGQLIAGDFNISITSVLPLSQSGNNKNALSWVSEKKFSDIDKLEYGIYIVPKCNIAINKLSKTIIQVNNPRYSFLKIMKEYFIEKVERKIENTAIIDKTSSIGKEVYIGHNVVIEKNCAIGNNSIIGHNSVICRGTNIGNDVTIGANCTIGGTGFGYEKNEEGQYCLMPHLGNVKIEDFVEIGNNSTIDRAVMGETLVKKNAKIDNLVQIGHGATIGENTLIMATSIIGGSTKIGKDCWIAPAVSIINKISIGNDTFVGIGAVVVRDVKDEEKIFGVPAKSIKKYS